MVEQESPRTRLEQLLRQRHVTLEEFRKRYRRAAGTDLSERQACRWVAGELRGLPYPQAQAALELLFGEPVARLLGPPYGTGAVLPNRRSAGAAVDRGSARTDWEGQVIAMSADRARDFLTRIEASNVGAETLDQLIDDVRRLVSAYQQQPLASHDLGVPHDALTQARTGYACADNAGHDGLRAWIRGLQALITYWSGRLEDSVRYAQLGADAATRSRGTASVWLASGEARSLAALNRFEEAHAALDTATETRERLQPDELDSLGGLCTFSRPRQLYYAADALAWGGETEANHTERLALEALETYAGAPDQDRAFGARGGGSGPGSHRPGGRHRRLHLRAAGASTMTDTTPHGVTLTGAKVRLREFRADDLDDGDGILGDDRVTRWLSFDSRTREQQAEVLAGAIERAKYTPRTEYYLAVTTHTDDRLIGFVRLGLSGVQAAKLGGAIAAPHWGHGYALDAARTLIGYGFTTLGLHRISAAIGPDNAASIAIVTRLGFTREGRLRDHVFTNGAWRDSVLYSLLTHEWEAPLAAHE